MENNENHGSAILNLKPAEISNPLLVITDFFSDDSLPGHLERLQKWRNCVLEEQYFKGDKGSPSELLYFYKLNVCLLEAAFLLKDRPDLHFTELADPLIVIKKIYEYYDLSAYQEMLYEWLEFGLSARAANEAMEAVDMIRVYENLQRLYGAAWNINQRFANTSLTAHQASIEQSANILIESYNVALYKLDPTIGSHLQETISNIVAKIKEKVSSVQGIIYLGQPPVSTGNIYLLVLVDDKELRQLQCIASTIQDSCRQITSVTALVHRPSRLNRISGDNLFFSNALKSPIIYLSGELLLPSVTVLGHSVREKELIIWQRWMEQGKDFLKGAEYYLTIGSKKAALFSLQQAAECFLIAIIRVVNGYTTNLHNLDTLLEITKMFSNDIAAVFDLTDQYNLKLFNVLKNAYINVRYKDGYELDDATSTALYPYIKNLMFVVEQVYQKYLLTNTL